MESIQEKRNRNINIKLFPIYKMFSWDLLFYYSIIYLFLVQVKHFSASQVFFGEAFFMAACLFLQIPTGILVDKFGKKNSLVFANICLCVFAFLLMYVQTYEQLLVVFFIDAIGFVIKGCCENIILYDSLPSGEIRGKMYSEIDGKGLARHYLIDTITAVIAGFSYIINPYYPIICCLIVNIIATLISTQFRHTQMMDEEEERATVKRYFKDLREVRRFALKSKRMLSLLLFFGLVSGMFYSLNTYRSNVLDEIMLPEQYFGIVLAVSQIMASLFSRLQILLHKKFRNKTLSVLGIPLTISCIIIGFLAKSEMSTFKTLIIILLFIMQGAIKGAYQVLIYRYLNNFTNSSVRIKLATIRNIIYSAFAVFIIIIGAFLLTFASAANTIIIIGCVTSIIMVVLLDYMKGRVGLKPEEYKKIDLKYSSIRFE